MSQSYPGTWLSVQKTAAQSGCQNWERGSTLSRLALATTTVPAIDCCWKHSLEHLLLSPAPGDRFQSRWPDRLDFLERLASLRDSREFQSWRGDEHQIQLMVKVARALWSKSTPMSRPGLLLLGSASQSVAMTQFDLDLPVPMPALILLRLLLLPFRSHTNSYPHELRRRERR